MNRRNYEKEMQEIIRLQETKPTLLLHSCCAPCSSAVLEDISRYFHITVLYYNPNISSKEEYDKRVKEVGRLLEAMPFEEEIPLIEGRYDAAEFEAIAKGLEDVPEGGSRCFACYRLRLEEAGRVAKEGHFDYFTTTLSISPLKNAAKLNEIGEEVAQDLGISYLPSDFKKKERYKRSIALSKEYDLYRQNFCGCKYSKKE